MICWNPLPPSLRFSFLGRLLPMKGIEHLLKTVDTFEHPPEAYVGRTREEAYVNRLRDAYEHSRIHFLGFVAPTNFFAEIDVLVVPFVWHERFGRVVIEAYAHGTPVIAARRGGLPQIVGEGTTRWTFDPDGASSLRRCIERVRDAQQQVVMAGEAARSRPDDTVTFSSTHPFTRRCKSTGQVSRRTGSLTPPVDWDLTERHASSEMENDEHSWSNW